MQNAASYKLRVTLIYNHYIIAYVAQNSEDVVIDKTRINSQQEHKNVTQKTSQQNDIVDHRRGHSNHPGKRKKESRRKTTTILARSLGYIKLFHVFLLIGCNRFNLMQNYGTNPPSNPPPSTSNSSQATFKIERVGGGEGALWIRLRPVNVQLFNTFD